MKTEKKYINTPGKLRPKLTPNSSGYTRSMQKGLEEKSASYVQSKSSFPPLSFSSYEPGSLSAVISSSPVEVDDMPDAIIMGALL